jgi:hypothetical protein
MKRRNRGQVLVLVALAIFVLLGFAALGIDVGFIYSVRHELQRSADAGALAGASAFTTGDWNNSSVRSIADSRAREFASKDKVVQTTLNPASEVAVSFPLLDRIEVVTSRNANLFFARILGMPNRLITARAVAQASVAGPPVNVNCIKPWAIPVPWNDLPSPQQGNRPPEPNGLWDPGPPPEEVYVTNNPDGTWTPRCVDPLPAPTAGMCVGTQMTLKIGSPSSDNTSPSGQQTSGQFFIIQGNLGGETFQGANDMAFFIREGCFPIDLTLPADLMTGNMMGPTVKAVEDLIGMDSQATWNQTDGHPDPTTAFPNWEASPRVVRVALYNPSIPMSGSSGGHGTHTYIPVGYQLAGFWVESVGRQGNDGWVTGRYIPGAAFGGSGTPGPFTGTEVKVIALVE